MRKKKNDNKHIVGRGGQRVSVETYTKVKSRVSRVQIIFQTKQKRLEWGETVGRSVIFSISSVVCEPSNARRGAGKNKSRKQQKKTFPAYNVPRFAVGTCKKRKKISLWPPLFRNTVNAIKNI